MNTQRHLQMIVSVQETGVLELYWRHRVSRHPVRNGVWQFLSEFRTGPQQLRTFPSALTGQGAFGAEDALDRFTQSITLGELIVLQHKGEMRWPGTRTPVLPLSRSHLLLSMSRTHAARNLARAREWLLDTGREEADVVWKTLWIAYGRASEDLASMEDFIVTVQTLLEKGELVPVYHHLPVHVADVVQSPQQGLPPVTSRSEPSAPDEGTTFESDHAVPAQVSVLVAAASAGVPFCEVCHRAAQQPPPPLTWKEKEKALHWIEIQLVGEDDSPVGNIKYRVRLPDGEIVTGTLNDNGLARLDRLEQSGTCEVCFPDLDKEAWTHVRTQG